MSRRILVVEDDPAVRELVAMSLSIDGFEVLAAPDASIARQVLSTHDLDLVVLDVMMPGVNGHDFLAEIRGRDDELPVIMLTAVINEASKLQAFGLGADDYVTKPFHPAELSARVEAVLRRAVRSRAAGAVAGAGELGPPRVVEAGGLRIDLDGHRVWRDDELVELTAREFDLLAYLASHPGRAFSRGQLLDAVWNSSSEWQQEATVTEHVRRLRLKLEDDPDRPRWLQTVRGVGYRFERRQVIDLPGINEASA